MKDNIWIKMKKMLIFKKKNTKQRQPPQLKARFKTDIDDTTFEK
jgi:hypothetical protein